jgi:hypothetical protein
LSRGEAGSGAGWYPPPPKQQTGDEKKQWMESGMVWVDGDDGAEGRQDKGKGLTGPAREAETELERERSDDEHRIWFEQQLGIAGEKPEEQNNPTIIPPIRMPRDRRGGGRPSRSVPIHLPVPSMRLDIESSSIVRRRRESRSTASASYDPSSFVPQTVDETVAEDADNEGSGAEAGRSDEERAKETNTPDSKEVSDVETGVFHMDLDDYDDSANKRG